MAKDQKKVVPSAGAFEKELHKAFKKFDRLGWLGKHSPLAAPYFLGEYLLQEEIEATTPFQRGEVLQNLLRESVEELKKRSTQEKLYSEVLRLAYVESWKVPKIMLKFTISEATYHRYRSKGIEQLAQILIARLKPALRLESPTLRQEPIGRKDVLDMCEEVLKEGHSVGLSGPSGVGKTTLGIHVATQVAAQVKAPVFWFTFRLGINDHPRSLLFELAHFFTRQGIRSSLWAELVADTNLGQGPDKKMNMALGFLRYDLERLPQKPLLCFDEVDLLQPHQYEAHASLLAFLQSLKELTPLLLMGQQLPLEVKQQHDLHGLSLASIEQMFKQANIELSMEEIERVKAYTQGNPRLVELFIGSYPSGETMETLFTKLASLPSVEFWLRYTWQRLSEEEKSILVWLVPFRRAAPRDAWREEGEEAALKSCLERRLLQEPREGEIALLPAFRSVLYKWLSADDRQTVHWRAAMIRSQRAEYTAAAYHYLQAGETQVAFRLWHAHQEEEINQGQAKAALNLFEGIAQDQLPKRDHEDWRLLQVKLLKITGQYEQIERYVVQEWEIPALKAQAKRLQGDIADVKGELQEAKEAYRAGLETIEKLLSEKVLFQKNLSWMAIREGQLEKAWHNAILADYETANLKGYIQERMGDYAEAKDYYLKAIKVAEEANDQAGLAKTSNNLGRLLTMRGQFDVAKPYLEQAYQYFKGREQISQVASIRVNQAMFLNLAREHQAAIAPAKEALDIFERLKEPWGRRVARLQLAEAFLGIREFDKAKITAQQIIQKEEGRGVYDAWWVVGEVQLAQTRNQDAVTSFQLVIDYAQEHSYRLLEAYAQRSQGKAYCAMGDHKKAEEAFGQAIALFQALNMQKEVEITQQELKMC